MPEKLRVAVSYRVCQQWRSPIFERLAAKDDIELMVFHGEDIPGTKLVSDSRQRTFRRTAMLTWSLKVRTSGRPAVALLHPTIGWHLNRFKPDVVLAEGPGGNLFTNFLLFAWAKWHRVPLVWWTLGDIPDRRYSAVGKLGLTVSNYLLRRSSALLGYSTRARKFMLSQGCTQPVFVGVNCVDTDRVLRLIEQAGGHPAAAGRPEKQTVLFVGALTRQKRIGDLIDAFAAVRKERDDVCLSIVGDGEERQNLERHCRDIGVPDVVFTGRVTDGVEKFFLAADIFVLPGLGGLAISEAMCYGLPIICTTGDGCEEDLVRHGENGLRLATGDIAGLARSISVLASDPALRKQMGLRSRQIVDSEHNVSTYVDAIHAAVCSAGKPRASRSAPTLPAATRS